MTKTKKDDFCVVDLTNDVTCERGTRGCDVDHTKPVDEKYAAELDGRFKDSIMSSYSGMLKDDPEKPFHWAKVGEDKGSSRQKNADKARDVKRKM